MAIHPGVLTLTVERATELKCYNYVVRMDPFCVVRVGNHTRRTRTAVSGGVHPLWNETFSLALTIEKEVLIDIKDERMFGDDTPLGRATLDLSLVRSQGSDLQQLPVRSRNTGRQHGALTVFLKWQPSPRDGATSAMTATAVPLTLSYAYSQPQQEQRPPSNPAALLLQQPTTVTQPGPGAGAGFGAAGVLRPQAAAAPATGQSAYLYGGYGSSKTGACSAGALSQSYLTDGQYPTAQGVHPQYHHRHRHHHHRRPSYEVIVVQEGNEDVIWELLRESVVGRRAP